MPGGSGKKGISEAEVAALITAHATISPSDALYHSNDPQKQSSSTPWVKHKEIVIAQSGTIRVSFDLRGQSEKVYGRIYRNGSPIGTQRSCTTSWATFSEDISGWSPGDLLQLYARSEYADWVVYTKNLRLYGDNAAGACNTLGYTEPP